ncbi:16152_t:CDS:2, partial [Racocetra persica]
MELETPESISNRSDKDEYLKKHHQKYKRRMFKIIPLERLHAIYRDIKSYHEKIAAPVGPILIATGYQQEGGIVTIVFLYTEFNTKNLRDGYQELAEILKNIDTALSKELKINILNENIDKMLTEKKEFGRGTRVLMELEIPPISIGFKVNIPSQLMEKE